MGRKARVAVGSAGHLIREFHWGIVLKSDCGQTCTHVFSQSQDRNTQDSTTLAKTSTPNRRQQDGILLASVNEQ